MIQQLDLSNNKFEEIPLEVGNLELLKEINEWEVGIGQLINMTDLNISNNSISVWPPQLEMLRQLTNLDFSNNLLEMIPPVLASHPSLTQLNLENNKLAKLPVEIYELPLKVIVLLFKTTKRFFW